ncbi:hypothetical protein HZS_6976, partial [Henneguya salminicola]
IANTNDVINNVTIVIKTGGRFKQLINLCTSIWEYYPKIKIIIVDDYHSTRDEEFLNFRDCSPIEFS